MKGDENHENHEVGETEVDEEEPDADHGNDAEYSLARHLEFMDSWLAGLEEAEEEEPEVDEEE